MIARIWGQLHIIVQSFFVVLFTSLSAYGGEVSLIADSLEVTGAGNLRASGNVLILYEDTQLDAASVAYFPDQDRLEISGPLTLTMADGNVMQASQADLTTDLRNGLLKSARLVLDQQLNIDADQIERVDGRYTKLTNIRASSCKVCAKNPVPLWQIRAGRVEHDELEKQLYFHDAQMRIAGVPVLYLPRLRIPDPTLTRATGFLPMRALTTTSLGVGVMIPYFIKVNDHVDLTVTPMLAANARSLTLGYRQALVKKGKLEFETAVSEDSLTDDALRYYFLGKGEIALPQSFRANFDLQFASDNSYLLDHDISNQDKLKNYIGISRARRDELVFAGLTRYATLRDSEIGIEDQLPFAQVDSHFERRLFPFEGQMGELRFHVGWQAHYRESTLDQIGRDMGRASAGLDWRKTWRLPKGLLLETKGEIVSAAYRITQDSRYQTQQSYVSSVGALTLKWPMARHFGNGMSEVLEPVFQLSYTRPIDDISVPNEDSVFVELDHGNLFDLSYFPGSDAHESGWRSVAGVKYSRVASNQSRLSLGVGRVLHQAENANFSQASGLSGTYSDWLLSGQISINNRMSLTTRGLFDDNVELSKSESIFNFQRDEFDLGASHIWVAADSTEDRAVPIHELKVNGGYQINDRWNVSSQATFDAESREATSANLAIGYRNDCATLDLTLSRRFTSSENVTPTTSFGFRFELTGFGASAKNKVAHCG